MTIKVYGEKYLKISTTHDKKNLNKLEIEEIFLSPMKASMKNVVYIIYVAERMNALTLN